jgi:LPXTG-motif cell wall-anchored protein
VDQGDVTYTMENSTLDDSGAGKTGDYHVGYQLTVVNDEGVALPHTGGPGTGLFTVFGWILTAGAGLLLWRRQRFI